MVLPEDPPRLNPGAAQALLTLLHNVHAQRVAGQEADSTKLRADKPE